MESTLRKLEEIKKHGYRLDFGQTLEQSFDNYKKIALIGGAVIFIIALGFTAIWGSIVGIIVAGGDFMSTMTEMSLNPLSPTTIIINLCVGIIGTALIAPLTAGLLKIAHYAETYKEYGFSTAFDHYKGRALAEILLATVVITLFSQGLTLLLQLVGSLTDLSDALWFKLFVGLCTSLVSFLTYMTIPFIIFGELKASQAINGSIIIVFKRFWVIFLLLLVCFVCALFGLIGFCIGILFTMPIMTSVQYMIYRNAISIDEVDELEEIGFKSEE